MDHYPTLFEEFQGIFYICACRDHKQGIRVAVIVASRAAAIFFLYIFFFFVGGGGGGRGDIVHFRFCLFFCKNEKKNTFTRPLVDVDDSIMSTG